MEESLPVSFLEGSQEDQDLYGEDINKTLDSEAALEAEPSGEDNPFGDSDDEEDEVQVTIGKIEPRTVQYNVKSGAGAPSGKIDIDNTAVINDKPIYDFDLASMDDRPWRKPGADITDYFNYGFTEDSWNTYCERQKKLRTEYPIQSAANKALFSNIHLANPLAMPTNIGGRRLVSLTDSGHGGGSSGNVKVLTDNGGRFKVHSHSVHYQKLSSDPSEPILRTVIGGNSSSAVSSQANSVNVNTAAPPPTLDFSKPPPGLTNLITHIKTECPPGVEGPPGVDGPPGESQAIPTLGAPGVDMSMPPPGFNPSLPPPLRPPPMNLPPPGVPVNVPPPQFGGMMPPPFQQRFPPMGGLMGNRDYDMSRRESGDYEDRDSEDDRRRYRRRSRSRSPLKRDLSRRRDDDRRTSDRDRKDRERDRDRTERSRRHRSRSASPDRKRKDDREKRRVRDDDDDRRKRRYDRDDEDRRDRRERRKREDESPQPRDSDDLAPPGVDSAD